MEKNVGKQYLGALGLIIKLIKNVVSAPENDILFESIIPSKWKFNSGPLMLTHIDSLMYLLFYGIGSSTIVELQTIVKR